MAESSDSCGVCAHLLSCAFCCNRDWDAGDEYCSLRADRIAAWRTWFKTKKILLSGICLSGIIEVSQFAFCKGLCETDDVMHNSVGAFLGYLGFLGILKGKRILYSKFSGSF